MVVYGLWHGGDSYAEGTVFDSLEKFPSVEFAKWEFTERYNSNGKRTVEFFYVSPERQDVSVYVPVVNESATMKLWFADPRESNDNDYLPAQPSPDRIIEFGPRMGARVRKVLP